MKNRLVLLLSVVASVLSNCPRCPELGLTGTLMVSNRMTPGSGTFIDLTTGNIFAIVSVGDGPHQMDARGDLAVWAAFSGNVLTVVHIPTRTVLHTIDLLPQRGCHGVQFLDGDHVLLACSGLGVDPRGVLMVDVRNGAVVQTIDTSPVSSMQLARLPNNSRTVYVSNVFGNTLGRVDLVDGVLTGVLEIPSVPAQGGFEGIGVTLDGHKIWLAQSHPIGALDSQITIVDAPSFSVDGSFPTGGSSPVRAEHTFQGVTVVPHLIGSPAVQFYNTSNRELIAQIDSIDDSGVDASSETVLFLNNQRYALLSNAGLNLVAIIDMQTYQIVAEIFGVTEADGLGWVPESYFKPLH